MVLEFVEYNVLQFYIKTLWNWNNLSFWIHYNMFTNVFEMCRNACCQQIIKKCPQISQFMHYEMRFLKWRGTLLTEWQFVEHFDSMIYTHRHFKNKATRSPETTPPPIPPRHCLFQKCWKLYKTRRKHEMRQKHPPPPQLFSTNLGNSIKTRRKHEMRFFYFWQKHPTKLFLILLFEPPPPHPSSTLGNQNMGAMEILNRADHSPYLAKPIFQKFINNSNSVSSKSKTIQHTPMTWCTYLQSFEKIHQCVFELQCEN